MKGYFSDEVIQTNTKIGLNQIVAQYNSGVYEEITVEGALIKAKKKATLDIDPSGKKNRSIDQTMLPQNVKITDLGLSNPNNPTKISIQEEGWGKLFSDSLPSIIGTIIFIVFLFFMMNRMGGGM